MKYGQPNAEDAKISQRTQKSQKGFLMVFLRLLRVLRVCVRLFGYLGCGWRAVQWSN